MDMTQIETPTETVAVAPAETDQDAQLAVMAKELEKVTISSLRTFLENFGQHPQEDVSKKDLIAGIIKMQQVQLAAADKQTAEGTALLARDEDVKVRVTFHNHESPGADIEFCYDGGKGFAVTASGKTKPLAKFHLYDGREYTLPLSVVNWLNTRKVAPDAVVTVDAEGLIHSLYPGAPKKNRFSCSMIFNEDEIRRMQALKG